MKKALILMGMVCFLAAPVFAQATTALKAMIIDNESLNAHRGDLLRYVQTYTKESALRNASTGFSLLANGKIYKLDVESNVKIEQFLKAPDSTLDVIAHVQAIGDYLSILSLRNQK